MKSKEIITKYNIKHVYFQKALGITKQGMDYIFRLSPTDYHEPKLRQILKDLAKGILRDLKKK